LRGRGKSRITRVEVSTDGGASWAAARLTGPVHKFAWRRFEFDAVLKQSEVHTILSRATDDRGATQPVVPRWNPSGICGMRPIASMSSSAVRPRRPRPQRRLRPPTSVAANPTFERACRACHADDLVAQQRLTREGWGREVDKMIRWGARVTPEERGPLVEFLASRWGVR
jgi:hypothetical protein